MYEPEDHAAALCEVMALLIEDQGAIELQAGFFNAIWLPGWAFFDDLQAARSAAFYQAVAQTGAAFIRFEQQYFSIQL
ncbi:MAG: hypothetical protein R3E95_02695 [Thiolinea sp.]